MDGVALRIRITAVPSRVLVSTNPLLKRDLPGPCRLLFSTLSLRREPGSAKGGMVSPRRGLHGNSPSRHPSPTLGPFFFHLLFPSFIYLSASRQLRPSRKAAVRQSKHPLHNTTGIPCRLHLCYGPLLFQGTTPDYRWAGGIRRRLRS